ncbi:MAG: hypothetical protein HXK93_02300 [Candidatus Nanogingivalaceae bacterium]|nr:hypothetical protein [Candidatus Nanogingivalaceae bacterium]
MGDNKEVAFLKRNAINKANQTMFLAVAGAALIAGASVVGMIYLFRIYSFNIKVLTEQDKSISTITQNIENINDLKERLGSLETNENLNKENLKSNADDGGLRVIADALPDSENASGLGSALQKKIFSDGVTLDAFNIESSDSNSLSTSASTSVSSESSNIPEGVKDIQFTASISASFPNEGSPEDIKNKETVAYNNIVNTLQKMEKSIRAINVTSFKFERSINKFTLTLSAKSYYYPKYVMTLDSTKVKADDAANPATTTSGTGTQTNSTTTSGGSK